MIEFYSFLHRFLCTHFVAISFVCVLMVNVFFIQILKRNKRTMPVLEKLKEDIISSSPPSYIAVDGHLKDNIPNGCVVVDHDQENNTNSNYENLSKLTKSNSSATKLGFKKKMSGINLKHKLGRFVCLFLHFFHFVLGFFCIFNCDPLLDYR